MTHWWTRTLLAGMTLALTVHTGPARHATGTAAPHDHSPATALAVPASATPDDSTSSATNLSAPAEPLASMNAAEQGAPPSLTLLGQLDLSADGPTANVRALDGFAYVGSWGGPRCPSLGVRIVDLADPANPTLVATAARFRGTSAEDIVPVRVHTPTFDGTLLAVGIQRCSTTSGTGGLALVDVTDPFHPADLAFLPSGGSTGGVHELDVIQRDGRVLALLAVPGSELARAGGDVRIVDITDPRHPQQIADWGIRAALGITTGIGCVRTGNQVLAHSVHGGSGGARAYASYWDAGVIILDITDPTAPRPLGRITEPDEEGNFHSAVEAPGGLLLTTEETNVAAAPRPLRLRVSDGAGEREIAGCEASSRAPIGVARRLSGPVVSLGAACGSVSADATGRIALVDDGGCPLVEKARQAEAAGAQAMLLIGDGPAQLPINDSRSVLPVPVIGIGAEEGAQLRSAARAGTARVTLPSARPWGALRVWDISDPARPVRLAVFRTENAQALPPSAPGAYTVHNPLSAGRYALASWYSDGIRVIDLADPTHPVEVASFVPLDEPDVWGVELMGDLVLVSDIEHGLFVLRATGLP